MTTDERPTGLAALAALGRVAHALVGSGSLSELAPRALDEMRDGLGLELVVLYLPRFVENISDAVCARKTAAVVCIRERVG